MYSFGMSSSDDGGDWAPLAPHTLWTVWALKTRVYLTNDNIHNGI